jgi:hypothetical protein
MGDAILAAMRLSLPTLLSVLALAASAPAASADSFLDTTPGTMAFAVPAGVDSLSVAATGGAGGDLTNGLGTTLVKGGRAALVTGLVAVFPGEQLQLTVASNGGTANAGTGTNGGSGTPDGGVGGYSAGGGGGATRVLACQGVTCPVAVIAGGGGGAGSSGFITYNSTFPPLPGGPGGAAGARGTDGTLDVTISGGSGGQPGTPASAGAGGSGFDTGGSGSGPTGGAGGSPGPFNLHEGGGGGGGGVFGAGGGGSGGSGVDPLSNSAYAGGGGGGGGSSLAPSGTKLNLAAPGAAPGIVLTWTPPGGPGSGGVAVVSREKLSPSAFPTAPSGASALVSARRRYGAKVTYTLNQAADVRFTVVQRQPGRKTKSGHCAKPMTANSSARRCKRRVTLPGSFTRAGSAGANSFRFTGRLKGRKLKPGMYQLVATPRTGAKTGRAVSASFRIIA